MKKYHFIFTCFLLISICLTLASCGQAGGLYLPTEKQQQNNIY